MIGKWRRGARWVHTVSMPESAILSSMSTEKTFTNFIIIHEKNIMSKGINALEDDISSIFERVSIDESELTMAKEKLEEGIRLFKRILSKHDLYEI